MLLGSEDIFKEIDILCGLDHDNVVFFKEYFEEGSKVGIPPGSPGCILLACFHLILAALDQGSQSEP